MWAATSPLLDGLGGLHLEDSDVASPSPESGERTGVMPWALDPEQAERLSDLSAELTDENAFG